MTVFDTFNFGAESLLNCSLSKNLSLVKGDIRDVDALKKVMEDAEYIIHLAAIVGFPACKKYPELATSTNLTGTKNIIDNLQKHQKLIFSSTGSCYGAIPNGFCTEETPLSPLTLYGQSKAEGEALVQAAGGVSLRLATIFGISQRLRLDLLINDLCYKALTEKKFDIYEAHFRRTFLHVKDVARAFVFAIENYDKMEGGVFNVGADSLNCTKSDICNYIMKHIKDCVITPSLQGQDPDKRDYEVSYEKIRKLGFESTITIEDGIKELVKFLLHVSPQYLEKTKNI